jgi:hypothetical protein
MHVNMQSTLSYPAGINQFYGSGFQSMPLIYLSISPNSYELNTTYTMLNAPFNGLTIPIYECLATSKNIIYYFISRDNNCEGGNFIRLSGYIYNTKIENTIGLYNCSAKGNSFHRWVVNDLSQFTSNNFNSLCGDYNSNRGDLLGYVLLDTLFINKS